MRGASPLIMMMWLTGCTVSPDYQAPERPAPGAWQAPTNVGPNVTSGHDDNAAQAEADLTLARWWTWFNDPLLNSLVERALAANLDIRAFGPKFAASRAERRSLQAGASPSLNLATNAQRLQNPLPGLAPGITFSLYELGFDAKWEIDFFGRLKRRLEAADASLAATVEEERWVRNTVIAEVVRAYVEMRGAERRLALVEDTLTRLRESVTRTKELADAGLISRDQLHELSAQVAGAATQVPALRTEQVLAQRQLELLMGQDPGTLEADLTPLKTPLPVTTPKLLASPAAVLRNRPDIRRAERQLAATTALRGASIADLYPRISLGLFFGLRNTAIGALFSGASKSWSGGGSLLAPIFDAGRLRAAVDLSDARVKSALIEFEKANLAALHETEAALTQLAGREQQRAALAIALADRNAVAALAAQRYQHGVADKLSLLKAETEALSTALDLARVESAISADTVAVMKTMGGGATGSEQQVSGGVLTRGSGS